MNSNSPVDYFLLCFEIRGICEYFEVKGVRLAVAIYPLANMVILEVLTSSFFEAEFFSVP